MRRKIKFILAGVAVLYTCNCVASSTELAGARGTMRNIDSAINTSVSEAEKMFEENQGKTMQAEFNLISQDNKNPYLSKLSVAKDYKIQIKLADTAKGNDGREVPVAQSLLGKEILLIPVYYKGDEKITSWECLTNADMEVQRFIGDVGTKEYTASFIRDYTDNTYLSLCTYIKKQELFTTSE